MIEKRKMTEKKKIYISISILQKAKRCFDVYFNDAKITLSCCCPGEGNIFSVGEGKGPSVTLQHSLAQRKHLFEQIHNLCSAENLKPTWCNSKWVQDKKREGIFCLQLRTTKSFIMKQQTKKGTTEQTKRGE